jgi:alpha-tubulin suppressor-like RCC1 family protein
MDLPFGASTSRISRIAVGATALAMGMALLVAVPSAAADSVSAGGVSVWGANYNGQFADGVEQSVIVPTAPTGLPGPVTGMSAFGGGTLVKVGTTWYGWGNSYLGELCTGSTGASALPVASQLPDAVKVAGGTYHEIALLADGSVVGCGNDQNGELGDGHLATGGPLVRTTPVPVTGLSSGVVDVAAGQSHSLALLDDGTVRAWGDNYRGQLGTGTPDQAPTPAVVVGATDVVAVAAGSYHSLALTSSGTVLSWGANIRGELGDGTTTQRETAAPVPGLTDVVAIAAGGFLSMAITSDGSLWAWGWNEYGQLGDGTTTDVAVPQQVPGLNDVTTVAIGLAHVVARRADGSVVTWGMNYARQLGNSTVVSPGVTPAPITGLTDVVAVAAGIDHTTVLLQDGTVRSWGGSGKTGSAPATFLDYRAAPGPAVSPASAGVVAVSASASHVLALTDAGTVLSWGAGQYGQLGNGGNTGSATPSVVPGLAAVRQVVTSSNDSSYALRTDGSVVAWGSNDNGELGEGSTASRRSPVAVTGLARPVTAIAAGGYHGLALLDDGTVAAWGANFSGQLGDGTTDSTTSAHLVPGLSGIVAIGGTDSSSFAIDGTGALYAWGGNDSGQLGDGSTTSTSSPQLVAGVDQVVAVAGGSRITVALRADGSVWTWGTNSLGGLGDGTTTDRFTPAPVPGLGDVVAVDSRGLHVLALRADGSVAAWGYNAAGQVGVALTMSVPAPVDVPGLSGPVRAIAAGAYTSFAIAGAAVVSAPGAPTAVSASAGDSAATVSWTAPADDGGSPITSYTVTAAPGGATATVPAGSTSATMTGLANGTAYTFTVRATNDQGDSVESSPSTAVTPVGAPGAPTSVTGASRVGAIRVTWVPPVDTGGLPVTNYLVRTVETGSVRTVAGTATAVLISGLTAGTPYTFTVVARNAAGDSGASAPSLPVTPATGPPDAPTDVAAVAASASATISWTAPVNTGGVAITSYTVTASPGGKKKTVSAPLTSATIAGLVNGTAYTFTVVAKNAANQLSVASAPSSPVTPLGLPSAPTVLPPTAYKAAAVVTWAAPAATGGTPITGYVVEVFKGTVSTGTIAVAAPTTTLTVTGLTNGSNYRFTVRAVNAVGTGPASAKSVAVKPLATLPPPP